MKSPADQENKLEAENQGMLLTFGLQLERPAQDHPGVSFSTTATIEMHGGACLLGNFSLNYDPSLEEIFLFCFSF